MTPGEQCCNDKEIRQYQQRTLPHSLGVVNNIFTGKKVTTLLTC